MFGNTINYKTIRHNISQKEFEDWTIDPDPAPDQDGTLNGSEWLYRYNPMNEREQKRAISMFDVNVEVAGHYGIGNPFFILPVTYYLLGTGREQYAVFDGVEVKENLLIGYYSFDKNEVDYPSFGSPNPHWTREGGPDKEKNRNRLYFWPVEYNVYGANSSLEFSRKITSNPNLIGQSSVEWKKYYYITDNLGSVRLVLEKSANESGFTLTKSYKYKPFGEIQHNFSIGPIKDNFDITSDRKMWIAKESDKESDLGDLGWRKYDNELGRFLSPDPLWEKYASLSPYQYSANNPVIVKDDNGKEGVQIIDDLYRTITAKAVYVYETANYTTNPIIEVNNYLNKQNYIVSDGQYKGYSVNFDLEGVPDIPSANHLNDYNNYKYMGVNIGNTFDQADETFTWEEKYVGTKSFAKNPFTGEQIGGVTFYNKNITMNKVLDNLRRRIHEIFHTLFFHNDDAEYGIGSYKQYNDMPGPSDIQLLLKNLPVVP